MGLRPALFWFALVATLGGVWWLLDLPSEEETLRLTSTWIAEYGLASVFVATVLEALLFVGVYFPGSVVIFLSVALAPTSIDALWAVVAVSLGMLVGYSLNYAMGKYGWYRVFLKLGMRSGIENAQIKLERNALRYVFYTYWNPGLAAFTSTAAGILNLPYRTFLVLTLAAIAVWNTFWGILVYSMGSNALMLLDFTLVLKVIALWVVFELLLLLWRRRGGVC